MGIALWLVSSVAAFFLAKMLPWRRPSRWLGEFLVSVLAGLALGVAATALDFGGWNEPDWRAGLFVFLGALAAAGTFRLTIRATSGRPVMKSLVLAFSAALLFSSCAAYKAQHANAAAPAPKPARVSASAPEPEHEHEHAKVDPLAGRQALLISELDKFQQELKENGLYDCCVKPACRQCAITAGECHCRRVIDAQGPCCGECTQSWVEGRGNTEGVDREKVLAHLGCVRELYEKKTPEGIVPPGQRKDQ
ncbi:MAG: hypothetical protein ACJ74H_13710 [Thermoanaerobaculia bacterium]